LADGKCLTSANNCSLRAAFMQADAAADLQVAIYVPAGTYKFEREPSGDDNGSSAI
jgi:hypothetical protein